MFAVLKTFANDAEGIEAKVVGICERGRHRKSFTAEIGVCGRAEESAIVVEDMADPGRTGFFINALDREEFKG